MDTTYATWTLTLLEPLTDEEVRYLTTTLRVAKMMACEAKSAGVSITLEFSEWNHPNVSGRETFESRFLPAYGPISTGKILVELVHGPGVNYGARYAIRRGDKVFVTPLGDQSELVLTVPLLLTSKQLDGAWSSAMREVNTYKELMAMKSKAIEWPNLIHDAVANDPWPGLLAIGSDTEHSVSMLLSYLDAAINRARLRLREYEEEPLAWLRNSIVDAIHYKEGALDRVRVAFNDLQLEAPYLAGAIRPALDGLINKLHAGEKGVA